jgi:hypothetical protein
VIVTVARHHMPRTADIDVIGVRYEFEKFFRMRLLHELGGSAAHKQGGDLDPARRLDQRRFEPPAVRFGRARNHCSLSGGRYANRSSFCIAVCWPSSGMMRCAGA